jgi:hypothetical protein
VHSSFCNITIAKIPQKEWTKAYILVYCVVNHRVRLLARVMMISLSSRRQTLWSGTWFWYLAGYQHLLSLYNSFAPFRCTQCTPSTPSSRFSSQTPRLEYDVLGVLVPEDVLALQALNITLNGLLIRRCPDGLSLLLRCDGIPLLFARNLLQAIEFLSVKLVEFAVYVLYRVFCAGDDDVFATAKLVGI